MSQDTLQPIKKNKLEYDKINIKEPEDFESIDLYIEYLREIEKTRSVSQENPSGVAKDIKNVMDSIQENIALKLSNLFLDEKKQTLFASEANSTVTELLPKYIEEQKEDLKNLYAQKTDLYIILNEIGEIDTPEKQIKKDEVEKKISDTKNEIRKVILDLVALSEVKDENNLLAMMNPNSSLMYPNMPMSQSSGTKSKSTKPGIMDKIRNTFKKKKKHQNRMIHLRLLMRIKRQHLQKVRRKERHLYLVHQKRH